MRDRIARNRVSLEPVIGVPSRVRLDLSARTIAHVHSSVRSPVH
jgi:hypothetical protein